MADEANLRRRGVYLSVVVAATAIAGLLRSVGLPALGSATYLLTLAGLLVYAFVKSGRDTTPARTWGESWRPRHLLMIALSLLIGFSALLIPSPGESAWVLLPILLSCVPLMFTPLAHISEPSRTADD